MFKKSDKHLNCNIYISTIISLGIIFLIFSLCRLFFYLLNTDMFPEMTFTHFMYLMFAGLKFDLSGILYTNILYIVLQIIPFRFRENGIYQKIVNIIFYITNSIAVGFNCIDIIYYRFTFRRTTWSVFQEFWNDKGNTALLGDFLADFWYILLLFILLIFLMIYLHKRIKIIPLQWKHVVYYPIAILFLICSIIVFIGGVRGGFNYSTRPITISNAGAYVKNPTESGIVLNTPFSIYRTIKRSNYQRLNYFDNETLEKIYSPDHYPPDSSIFKQKNVVILIVESLSKEYIGSLNKDLDSGNYAGYTPFIDSLIKISFTFSNSYANGTKSIDAMPSILASIPSLLEPYVLSIYSNNRIKGLATLLKEKSYDCSFFHGAPNGSMGFDAFAATSGFTHYYGKDEYANNNDFDGRWGIWDEPFLQFMANTLMKKTEPFFASVFTVTSHHPFVIPEQYEGKFPKGTEQIHQCIAYTDMALRRFFETASKMDWYKNTIFIITSDHTNQVAYPKSKTELGKFYIPIIIYEPGSDLIGISEDACQQIDIMPTVLGMLGYDKLYFAFGKNIFDSNKSKYSINHFANTFYIYKQDTVISTNDITTKMWNLSNDPLLQSDISNDYPETLNNAIRYAKAFRQTYIERLIDNKMVADTISLPISD